MRSSALGGSNGKSVKGKAANGIDLLPSTEAVWDTAAIERKYSTQENPTGFVPPARVLTAVVHCG